MIDEPPALTDKRARNARILVVEDDDCVRRLAAAYLQSDGYEVLQCRAGVDGLEAAERDVPDLLVLDLTLPGLSGLEITEKIRAHRDVPILMLTRDQSDEDVLSGFAAGADDCLTKPFSPRVLVARVHAILRRAERASRDADGRLVAGKICMDMNARTVTVSGREVAFTAAEFDLLKTLIEHPGWTCTREQLLESIGGDWPIGECRTIDGHIANLRKKVEEDPEAPQWIRTVRGVGYAFQA